MPPKPDKVLLVEGKEDQEVVYHLCNVHSVDNRSAFEVIPKDGYESLRDDLMVRPRSGVKVIGAVVDADENLNARWASLSAALVESGYSPLPDAPLVHGTIVEAAGGLPRIGLWVMPDNRASGILEDFVERLIHSGDLLLPRAQNCVDSIPANHRRFKSGYRTKATVHTWLAWQEDPGAPLGLAITRHYLDAQHELATAFLDWLCRLFSVPAQLS